MSNTTDNILVAYKKCLETATHIKKGREAVKAWALESPGDIGSPDWTRINKSLDESLGGLRDTVKDLNQTASKFLGVDVLTGTSNKINVAMHEISNTGFNIPTAPSKTLDHNQELHDQNGWTWIWRGNEWVPKI